MSVELVASLGDLKQLVRDLVGHTRTTPTASSELLGAVNFGFGKAVRAVASVRHELFATFLDPFTLLSGVTEYDVSTPDPPVWRPTKLIVDGGGGATRVITFRWRAIGSEEFMDSEVSRAGTFNTLYYDILIGMLPGTAAVTVGTTNASMTLGAGQGSRFAVGNLVSVPGAGPNITVPGGATVPTTYVGLVYTIVGDTIGVAPNMAISPGAGVTVTSLRRRILKIVPPVSVTISGRLYYQYRPAKLVNDTDMLDPILSEHRDMIVLYAASQLLNAVGDAQGRIFFEQAQELRSEAMQDLDPLVGSGSEAMGSDLWTSD